MKYRYHWLFKLLALVLAAVSGAAALLGCSGLVLDDLGYYERSRRSQLFNQVDGFCYHAANAVFDNYAWRDTGIEPKLFERFFRWGADVDAVEELEYPFYYQIRNTKNGELLENTCPAGLEWDWSNGDTYDVRRGFVTVMPKAEYYPSFDQFHAAGDGMVYVDLTGQALPGLGEGVTDYEYYVVSDDDSVNPQNISTDSYDHADANGADYTIYRLEYTHYDSYRVTVYMTAEQTAALMTAPMEEEFLPELLRHHPNGKGTLAAWGLAGLLLSLLWLALAAGRSPEREEVRPEGLNRLPLDLWLAAAAIAGVLLIALTSMVLDQIVYSSVWNYYNGVNQENYFWDLVMLALCGMGAGGVVALFTMACAAQMKLGSSYWLKHTAVGLCWRYGWKFVRRAFTWCRDTLKKAVRWITRVCRQFAALLPLSWQWLIASGCVWLLMLICCIVGLSRWEPWLILLGVAVTVLLVLYGAYCFGALRDTAKKMSEGALEEKIDDRLLLGCFGEFAGHLNALGDACVESARQQMKSERMRSELITNVSHDIKTPLTSIINYVDLLQKTGDEGERREYLEVLDRQSQRLKKLIEDLMEMSRASSGNVSVEITPTDVTEAVNQALGEFADTLQSCGLTVLCKTPPEPVLALCDGKHLWRVLSNVLSNVVKYALPGTRVYVDVAARGSRTEISVKNISAQMLNISAEELMERFVRGDSSRNTEGNGLGLNIAKSLMELQGGRLELVVDGDLFKVVLTLNTA
ncbi:MAG: HAMP domain-containing histidine kinase [Oscillospiraceae bacterium]|nr:HAMP domain-containing histidine kinase [Oscillospiraceae bacterium]